LYLASYYYASAHEKPWISMLGYPRYRNE